MTVKTPPPVPSSHDAIEMALPQHTSSDAGLLPGVSVLVVDDDAPSRKLVAVTLRAESCDVRAAEDAESALVILETFKPRVVIVDLQLPGMSGLQLAQRLTTTLPKDTILVAISAGNGAATERATREHGFHAFSRKPIEPAALVCHLLVLLNTNP